LRETAAEGFSAATRQMIDHFDGALTAFENDVREGKANVKVVSNRRGSVPGGGGGGSFSWCAVLLLLPLTLIRARKQVGR
jgi:rhombotail lipoprotein